YVSGLFQMDGTITGSASAQNLSIELGSVDRSHLVGVQRLLLNLGVYSRIYTGRKVGALVSMPDGKGGMKDYYQSQSWSLRVTSRNDVDKLYELVDWLPKHRQRYEEHLE